MKLQDIKIGQRLFAGFGVVLALLAIVWFTGSNSINKITYELDISKDVNAILANAQDAQAGSLRFVIYKDEKYNDIIKNKANELAENGKLAKSKMKKESSIEETETVLHAMEEYLEYSQLYLEHGKEQGVVGKRRAAAAEVFLNGIKKLVVDVNKKIVSNSRSTGKVSIQQFTLYSNLEKVYTAVDKIYIVAYKALLSITAEQRSERFALWLTSIDEAEAVLKSTLKKTNSSSMRKTINVILDAVVAYRVEAVNFQTIDSEQREQMVEMKNAAGLVMDDSRKVRDGVYELIENVKSEATTQLLVTSILALIVGMALAWFLTQSITTPIKKFIDMLKDIAQGEGDLTQRVSIHGKDEINEMSNWFNQFIGNVQEIIRSIKETTETVASASEELSAVSNQMLAGSEEMVAQSTSVASATEEMSTNITTMASAAEEMSVNANEVAGAAEQTSQNMNAVSSAVEEMSVSIGQIAQDAGTAREVSDQASASSQKATSAMGTLSEAAKEIGNVTEVIKRIAEQTNLLALNATIEAASAGEAGKGFAVVANEIKELANQSAKAADDIATRIDGVQSNTDEAVNVISDVTEVIEKVSSTITNIAQAVEQQNGAVNDISANVVQAGSGVENIAGSIAEVAKGANDVSRNSGEASKGATDVTTNISGIQAAAQETSSGAGQVNTSATDLSKMAADLQKIVGQFTI
jgi:methyl-accepting chemotaxis protein